MRKPLWFLRLEYFFYSRSKLLRSRRPERIVHIAEFLEAGVTSIEEFDRLEEQSCRDQCC